MSNSEATPPFSGASVRAGSVVALLIAIAVGIAGGRIATSLSREGDTAFGSANDRSRWATVASLVHGGTYEIDAIIARPSTLKANRRPWDTIDKVRHEGNDGEFHFYSSKPPLLATLVAGVYRVYRMLGIRSMLDDPIVVPRVVLATVNLPLLTLLLACVGGVTRRVCRGDFAWIMTVAAVSLSTLLLPFATTLNNHLPAAAATAAAAMLFCFAGDRRFWWEGSKLNPPMRWRDAAWIGFFGGAAAAMAVACELPALSMAACWGLLFVWADRRMSVPWVLGAGVIAAAFFATNWVAHESLRPPYAHRDAAAGDDWYAYPGSYWREGVRTGVDAGEPSRAKYLFHMMLGHHGVFSLTPIWILMPVGLGLLIAGGDRPLRRLAAAVALVSVVCVAFYVSRPLIDRNYGGVSVGMRWLVWLVPLWAVGLAAVADRWAGRRAFRVLFVVLTLASAASMATALRTPWQATWIEKLLRI